MPSRGNTDKSADADAGPLHLERNGATHAVIGKTEIAHGMARRVVNANGR